MSNSNYVLYRYTPNLECAVLLAALFAMTTSFHLYQRIHIHAKYFNPFIVGGICEFKLQSRLPIMIACIITNLIISGCSPGYRLCRACCLPFPYNFYHPLCDADPLYLASADPLRCFNIYGSWKNRSIPAWRAFELCACPIHDQGLCLWGRTFLYSPRRR